MKLKDLEVKLNEKLNTITFSSVDSALNCVQVGDLNSDIKRVALMVDASLEGFKQANKHNADLVLTHHGLFWGKPLAIKGNHFNRVKYLIDNNMALYSAHLPLDAHMELGNNVGIANALGLRDCEEFGKYKGVNIGVQGTLDKPITLDEVKKIVVGDHEPAYVVPGGKEKISTVAIVSGGSPYSVYEAIEKDIDLFITGDRSHEVYHTCLESGINMISAGHYATEVYGVKSVGKWLKDIFDLETFFIDLPTGA